MAKKILCAIMILMMFICTLISCGNKKEDSSKSNSDTKVEKEEWDALFEHSNYTAEGDTFLRGANERLLYKIDGTSQSIEFYDDNSALLSGTYYAMVDGIFYEITKNENSCVGYKSSLDNVYSNFFDSYGFEGMYDYFEYDNEKQAYFFDSGYASCYLYIKDKKITRLILTVNSDDDMSMDVKFTSYGKTEVSIPEFTRYN